MPKDRRSVIAHLSKAAPSEESAGATMERSAGGLAVNTGGGTREPPWPSFVVGVTNFVNGIRHAFSGFHGMLDAWGVYVRLTTKAEAAGWLPHVSTPIELLNESMSVEEVDAAILDFYQSHWDAFKAMVLAEVEGCALDRVVMEHFKEAIAAHESELYRASVMLLMAEIERAAGREPIYQKGERVDASLKNFADALARLPMGVLWGRQHSVRQFCALRSIVYMHIGEDEELRAQAANTAIPNRHACIHGLVDYATAKNSINAFVVVSYALQMVDAVLRFPSCLNPEARGEGAKLSDQMKDMFPELFPVERPPSSPSVDRAVDAT